MITMLSITLFAEDYNDQARDETTPAVCENWPDAFLVCKNIKDMKMQLKCFKKKNVAYDKCNKYVNGQERKRAQEELNKIMSVLNEQIGDGQCDEWPDASLKCGDVELEELNDCVLKKTEGLKQCLNHLNEIRRAQKAKIEELKKDLPPDYEGPQ